MDTDSTYEIVQSILPQEDALVHLQTNQDIKEKLQAIIEGKNYAKLNDLICSNNIEENLELLDRILDLSKEQGEDLLSQITFFEQNQSFKAKQNLIQYLPEKEKENQVYDLIKAYLEQDLFAAKFLLKTLNKKEPPADVNGLYKEMLYYLNSGSLENANQSLVEIGKINKQFLDSISPLVLKLNFNLKPNLQPKKDEELTIIQNQESLEPMPYNKIIKKKIEDKQYQSLEKIIFENDEQDLDQIIQELYEEIPQEIQDFFTQIKIQDTVIEIEWFLMQVELNEGNVDETEKLIQKLYDSKIIYSYVVFFKAQEINQTVSHPKIKTQTHGRENYLESHISKLQNLIESSPNYVQNFLSKITNSLLNNELEKTHKLSQALCLSCSEFVETNKEYFKGISKEIDQVLVNNTQNLQLQQFKQTLDQNAETFAIQVRIVDHLKKNHYQEVTTLLYSNINASQNGWELFQFYQALKQRAQDFSSFIDEDVLIDKITPINVRDSVDFVLTLIEKMQKQFKFQTYWDFKDEMDLIYWEMPVFYRYFKQYILQRLDKSSQIYQEIVKEIKFESNLTDIRDENIKELMIFLPQCKHTLNIFDFMSIDYSFDYQVQVNSLIKSLKYKKCLNNQLLIKILFDLIKRKQNFKNLIQQISKAYKPCLLTQGYLLNYLLQNSDSDLRTLLIQTCSNLLPLPLLSFDLEKQEKYKIFPELFYIFENASGILSFKISSNPNKGPTCASKLLNDCFQRDFELHQRNFINFGSIDIQFDYNFCSPSYVPIADVQGIVDVSILRKFYKHFKIFIIHYFKGEKNLLYEEQNYIEKLVDSPFIFSIENKEANDRKKFKVEKESETKYYMYNFNFNKLEDIQYQNIIALIKDSVLNQFPYSNAFIIDIPKRIKQYGNFLDFLSDFSSENQEVNHSYQVIKDIMKMIIDNVQDLHSFEFLPMNYLFKNFCRINNEIMEEVSQTMLDQKMEERERLKEALEAPNNPSQILELMVQLIDSSNHLGTTFVLSKLISGLLEGKLKSKLEKRTQLRIDIQEINQSKNDQEEIRNKIKQISQEIENQWFSMEFLYRELYLSQKFKPQQEAQKNYFNRLVLNQYQEVQPFEIIDGDNLCFTSGTFESIFQCDHEKVLIVSVIGPQSSGKSLLLNFLFGTQFQTSAGRCTKGVYGSIIKLRGTHKDTYQKILLLDTEGIQSNEARDYRFDQRIIFFILCVSHVVLICNKGEMNSGMSEVIKLTNDAISKLRENIIQEPQVNIIMNIVAQNNQSSLEKSIQSVIDSISIDSEQENLNKVFQISKANFFNLPFAFNRSGCGRLQVNKPSPDFQLRIEDLKSQILNIIMDNTKFQTNSYTIKEWFEFASNFWVFAEKFEGITKYTNLEQKKQDRKIYLFLKDHLEKKFQNESSKRKKLEQIQQVVGNLLQNFDYNQQQNIEFVRKVIHNQVEELFIKDQREIEEIFQEYCKNSKVSQKILVLRSLQLDNELKQILTEQKHLANQLQASEFDKLSHIISNEIFQKKINECLKEKSNYEEEDAQELFQQYYNNIKVDYKNTIKIEEIKDDQFQIVRNMYKNQYFDKFVQRNEDERFLLSQFQSELYEESGIQLIEKYSSQLIYFAGASIRPQFNKISAFLKKRRKNYLQKLDKNQIKIESNCQYINLKAFIQERFDFELLYNELLSAVCNFDIFSPRKMTDQSKIQIINKDLRVELSKNYINPENLCQLLLNIDTHLYKAFQHCPKSKSLYWTHSRETVKIALLACLNHIILDCNSYFEYDIQMPKIPYQSSQKQYVLYKNVREQILLDKKKKKNRNKASAFNISSYIITQDMYSLLDEQQKLNFRYFSSQISKKLIPLQSSSNYLNEYFAFLSDPSLTKINEGSQKFSEEVKSYFISMIEWNSILKEIENIVIENFSRTDSQDSEDTYSTLSMKDILREMHKQKDFTKYSSLSDKIIQRIAAQVDSLIKKIDEELEVFCFKISEIGFTFLHQYAQLLITVLNQQLEIMKSNYMYFKFKKCKKNQQMLFIAKLTSNDQNQDIAHAQRLSLYLLEHIIKETENKVQQLFEVEARCLSQLFQKNNFIQELEARVANQDQNQPFQEIDFYSQKFTLQDLANFYVDPKKLLEKSFQKQWKEHIGPLIQKHKELFKDKIKAQLTQVASMIQYFNSQLKVLNSNIDSNSLFVNSKYYCVKGDQQEEDVNLSLAIDQKSGVLQKAAVQYFLKYLKGQWDQKQMIDIDSSQIQVLDHIDLPISKNSKIDEDLYKIIQDLLQDQKISQLSQFAKLLCENLSNFKNQELKIEEWSLILDLKLDFKNSFIGCEEFCPLCRKQCDLQHDESIEMRVHKCSQGHQIIGFGGNKQLTTNKALTIDCDEFKDDHEVFYQGSLIKWIVFKNNFPNWDFDSSRSSAILAIEHNRKIWNIVGKEICRYFTCQKQLPIIFQKATKNSLAILSNSIHYVLMLDRSSSMKKQPWKNLIVAVQNFIEHLLKNRNQREQSRISAIGYDNSAEILFVNKEPHNELIKKIQFTGGGTEFQYPLEKALEIVKFHMAGFQKCVLCFLTDGYGDYPENAIKQFQKESEIMSKMNFQAIYLGSSSAPKVLKDIAKEMGGSVNAVIEAEQLINAFIKLVPNVYQQ